MAYNAEELRWREAVLSLEYCVRCNAYGVQWCHRNYGKSLSKKVSPDQTAAMCPTCHHEIDNGKVFNREERRAIMDAAIVETHHRLYDAGLLQLKR